MKKKYWLALLFFIGLLLLGYGWWHLKKAGGEGIHLKPTLKVAAINDVDIEAERIKMISKIILSNPLPINIKTNRLDYSIFIDSVKVIESAYTKPIRIHSSGSTVIEVPLEILKEPLTRLLKHFEKHKTDTADYTFKATFKVDFPVLGERKFFMEFTKRLPVFRPPKLEMEDVDVNTLGFDESKIDLVTQVTNPNLFSLKLKDGKYAFTMDNDIVMEGSLEKIIAIPAKGSSSVAMHLDLKTAKMGKFLWKMLFDKTGTPFKMNFRCKILTGNNMLKNSTMVFNITGTLDELKKP
jgi:LEA14-like dessication related protein